MITFSVAWKSEFESTLLLNRDPTIKENIKKQKNIQTLPLKEFALPNSGHLGKEN